MARPRPRPKPLRPPHHRAISPRCPGADQQRARPGAGAPADHRRHVAPGRTGQAVERVPADVHQQGAHRWWPRVPGAASRRA
ncbi:hypothetical protein G6F23_015248 [Rhizopus arrhizus]|nr:hypothetical protein G6F23_015248 [Rhizopus arrhizus]